MGRLGQAFVEILPNLKRWGAALRDDIEKAATPALNRGERRFSGFVTRVRDRLFSLSTAMAVAFGAAAAGLVTKFGLTTAAALQQAQISFETMLGSAKQATAFLDDLKKFAAETPFQLAGLVDTAKQLLGAGAAAKEVIPTLRAYGDAAGALGLSQEQFSRVMLATTQIMNKGKVSAEELLQITEAGIPIYPLLSRALGMPVAKIQELGSQGKLLAEDVLPRLQRQMAKEYGGAMARQAQTLTGLWSTFMDTLNLGLADALQPLVPVLQDVLPAAMDVTSRALKAGSQGIAAFIGWARDMVPRVRALFDDLKTYVPDIDYAGLRRAASTGISRAFEGLRARLPQIDFSGIATQLKGQAETWAGVLIDGVRTGIERGDWRPLGESLGTGVGQAIVSISGLGVKLAEAVLRWAGEVDWYEVGSEVGRKSFPFAIGFVSHMTDELVKTAKEHPFETAFAALLFLGIGRIAGKLKSSGSSLMNGFWGSILKAWYYAAKPFNEAIDWFFRLFRSGFVRGFRRFFPDAAERLSKGIRGLADDIGARALYMAERGAKLVRGLATGIGDAAGSVFGALLKIITRSIALFARAGFWLVRQGARLVAGFLRGIASTSVGRTITGLISRVTGPFRRAGEWLAIRGRQVVGGLLSGIKNQMSNIGSWIKANVVDPIVGAVKRFFGIKSPSTVMAGIGSNMMAGLLRGMLRQSPTGIVKKVFGGMPQALSAIIDKGLVPFGSLTSKAIGAIGGLFGGGGGGRPSNANAQLGQMLAAQLYGWVGAQWNALNSLIMGESGWRNTAQNPTSSAFGIFQFLNSTWGAVGARKTSDPYGQIVAGLRYIASVYGSPAAAYGAWLSRSPHWYDSGGLLPPGLSLSYNGTRKSEVVAPTDLLEESMFRALMRAFAAAGVGEVSVTVDGDELRRVIRVETRKQVSASASALKVGRR